MTPTLRPVRETLHELMGRPAERAVAGAPFDPSDSRLHRKNIFIVGVPRSGTTWLHQMLSTHPDVATAGEAHIFCEGVSALLRNHDNPDANMFLSTWVSRAELLTLIRELTDGVFETARRANRPEATHVLDKTPNHEQYAAHLAEVYPDAAYVHIIRDARDSVSSQRDLWGGWNEAARVWSIAAQKWRAGIEDNRTHLRGDRYHEVLYEDLVREPVVKLGEVFDAVGLEHDPSFDEQVVEFCRAPINVRPSDTRVGVRKWAAMDPIGEREIVREVGDLMIELGYLTDEERRDIVARRSWRDVPTSADKAARRVSRAARRRVAEAITNARQTGPVPAEMRRYGNALGQAVVRGEASRVVQLLAPHVSLTEDRHAQTAGADAVAARLLEIANGGRVATVQADAKAASVHLITADGLHRHLRTFGDATRASRLVLQG